MAHRIILTDRQRSALFDLPTDEASILKHYTLADATAGVKWSVIGQFENVARKGDRGPVPSRQAAKKTVNQRDIEEDARRSPALPLRPFSCTFGTALTADDDLEHIRARRRTENRIGFALQLCALRYPGRLLSHGEVIPETVLRSIGAQLGIGDDAVLTYAARRQTRQEHLEALRTTYGYRMFTGRRAREMAAWLAAEAEDAHSGEDLVRRFAAECRSRQIILPGITIIERRCADALVAAERRIEARIARRLDDAMRSRLDALLAEEVTDRLTRFVWLRKFEVGRNSADINRLLDRLEFLKGLGLSPDVLAGIPPHRVARLRRQGERYFSDGIRELSSERRLAILAVCALEWRAAIADTVVETHDRIVGRTWREAERLPAHDPRAA